MAVILFSGYKAALPVAASRNQADAAVGVYFIIEHQANAGPVVVPSTLIN
jgi:hypothetical protein